MGFMGAPRNEGIERTANNAGGEAARMNSARALPGKSIIRSRIMSEKAIAGEGAEKNVAEGVSRRRFIQTAAAGAVTAAVAGCATAKGAKGAKAAAPAYIKKIHPSDTINIGYIGVGVRGKQHMRFTGFRNPNDPAKLASTDETANLPRPLNVRAVAMSDCYKGNHKWAKEAVPDIKVYPNFEDLLADKDIDAVFIGTSDHNHAPVGIAAAQAGKAIYSEKCFANSLEAAIAYRNAVKAAGVVFQLGHQTRSGSIMEKARKALGNIGPDGKLGKVALIETYTNRNDPNGAWIYKIPPEAKPDNIDWERFTGNGPKREFNLDRFFRFRKYWDYGTGQAGDLLTHEFDAIKQITGLGVPDTCVATGGIFYHKDKRETPDTFTASFLYEKDEVMVNYVGVLSNGRQRERTLFGHDATLDMSNGVKVILDKDSDRPEYIEMMKNNQWVLPLGDVADQAAREKVKAQTSDTSQWTIGKGIYIDIIDGKQVNVTALHVLNFVECIRKGNVKTNCHVDMAFDEAVIAHMATQSFRRGCRVRWDAKNEKIASDSQHV
ncbi:Gfo/Idh/MocA family oxidoreductase [Candidatus Sumerlaeota bacterium]|nr:Gfo/Idh/MocA family oxidoreductase [Candidatus Sumerlaeota bacterium]